MGTGSMICLRNCSLALNYHTTRWGCSRKQKRAKYLNSSNNVQMHLWGEMGTKTVTHYHFLYCLSSSAVSLSRSERCHHVRLISNSSFSSFWASYLVGFVFASGRCLLRIIIRLKCQTTRNICNIILRVAQISELIVGVSCLLKDIWLNYHLTVKQNLISLTLFQSGQTLYQDGNESC